MKKIIALILCILFCFVSVSCSGGEEQTTVSDDTGENAVAPKVKLVLDSAAVIAGETVDIAVNISNSLNTACFDLYVFSDEKLNYESSSSLHPELIIASNLVENEQEKYVVVRGMVATTIDLLDENICMIKYKVAEDVKSGDELSITVQVPMYQLGLTADGNDVYSVSNNVVTENIVLIAE